MKIYKHQINRGAATSEAIKHTTFYYVKRVVFGGFLITGLLLMAEFVLLIMMSLWINRYAQVLVEGYFIFGFIMILLIVTGDGTPEGKLSWSLLIAIFPIAGVLMYLFVKWDIRSYKRKKRLNEIIDSTKNLTGTDEEIEEAIHSRHSDIGKLTSYMEEFGNCAAYGKSSMTYYSMGDDVVEPLLQDLRNAKNFIFMEYFMIEEGVFWNQILEVLKEKASEGVDVRVLYDDMGCVALLPRNYYKKLESYGIHVRVHARLTPVFTLHYNNRDHRKIVVIDGEIAYTGGFNLCDEYINAYEKFGTWKDNGVRILGDSVKQFSLMFLQMWNECHFNNDGKEDEYEKYLHTSPVEDDGLLIPYCDGPNKKETLAKNVYKDIINNASNYVWITSPYLILDHDIDTALIHAARSGIDVRIVVPHIPDKIMCFMIARSFYKNLLLAGVKIYEYKPGFIHEKTWLSDDRIGTVGSVNLDYRSLFLHYECGCLFYQNSGLNQIRDDFVNIFDESLLVDMDYYKKLSLPYRMLGRVFRIFGTMM